MLVRLLLALVASLALVACASPADDGETATVETAAPEVPVEDEDVADVEDVGAEPSPEPTEEAVAEEPEPEPAAPAEAAVVRPEVGERDLGGNAVFSDLRVCTPEGFDEARDLCAEDVGPELPADAGGIYCSAMVDLPEEATVQRAIVLDGVPVQEGTQPRRAGLGPYWFSMTYDSTPLPGGVWECVLSIEGEQEVRVPVGVVGEPGPVAWARGCDRGDSESVGGFRRCGEGAPATIEAPREIVCSATFVGLAGADVRIAVAEDGSPREAIDVTLNDAPITSHWAGFPRSGAWPAGSYSCQWIRDGEVLHEAPFTVTG
jgi:hypothetical protein